MAEDANMGIAYTATILYYNEETRFDFFVSRILYQKRYDSHLSNWLATSG